jgi:hypothetical protein
MPARPCTELLQWLERPPSSCRGKHQRRPAGSGNQQPEGDALVACGTTASTARASPAPAPGAALEHHEQAGAVTVARSAGQVPPMMGEKPQELATMDSTARGRRHGEGAAQRRPARGRGEGCWGRPCGRRAACSQGSAAPAGAAARAGRRTLAVGAQVAAEDALDLLLHGRVAVAVLAVALAGGLAAAAAGLVGGVGGELLDLGRVSLGRDEAGSRVKGRCWGEQLGSPPRSRQFGAPGPARPARRCPGR